MPIPQECLELANHVSGLEAEYETLRATLGSLQGANAWQALAKLGGLRGEIGAARRERDRCIDAHSAALRANLVVMDLTRGDVAANRSAHLWRIADSSITRFETREVHNETFAFKQLPPTFGISITTNGKPEVIGPDFRSQALTADTFPFATARVEVVLLPEIRLDSSVLAQIAADFTSSSHTVTIEGGGVSADLLLTSAEASLEPNAIVARVAGEAKIQSPIGGTQRSPFSASGKLRLVPSAAAAAADTFDLVSVSDLRIELPGTFGTLVGAILPMIRETLSEQLGRNQARTYDRMLIPGHWNPSQNVSMGPPGSTSPRQ
jgi:hypothetical protein